SSRHRPLSVLKQVLRSRARRALSPHPLSPSPHTRRGGTKGESRVPPLHIVERGTGGEDYGEGDRAAAERRLRQESRNVLHGGRNGTVTVARRPDARFRGGPLSRDGRARQP